MINIRFEGNLTELQTFIPQLNKLGKVVQVSKPYPNRDGQGVRVYARVEPNISLVTMPPNVRQSHANTPFIDVESWPSR